MNSQRQMFPFGFYLQEGYHPDKFREAFDLCHKELFDALFDCIHPEKDSNARQAQVRYVLQFRLLGERLHFFCDEIFQFRYGVSSPELKGVWFSSCGQHGNSINLLASEVARTVLRRSLCSHRLPITRVISTSNFSTEFCSMTWGT